MRAQIEFEAREWELLTSLLKVEPEDYGGGVRGDHPYAWRILMIRKTLGLELQKEWACQAKKAEDEKGDEGKVGQGG